MYATWALQPICSRNQCKEGKLYWGLDISCPGSSQPIAFARNTGNRINLRGLEKLGELVG